MKKTGFLLLFMLTACFAQAQNDAIVRFFDKYSSDERFTTVFVSPKMFELLAKVNLDENDEDWQKMRGVIRKLGGLRVLTCDSLSDGAALYKDALGRVPQTEYAELLTVRDGQENVRIWVKESGNTITELLLLVGAPDSFTLLSFMGNIDLDEISSLSKKLNVEGVEHLDKIKKKEKE